MDNKVRQIKPHRVIIESPQIIHLSQKSPLQIQAPQASRHVKKIDINHVQQHKIKNDLISHQAPHQSEDNDEESYLNFIDNDLAFRADERDNKYQHLKGGNNLVEQLVSDNKQHTQSFKLTHHQKGKLSETSQKQAESQKANYSQKEPQQQESTKQFFIPSTIQTVERALIKSNSNDNILNVSKTYKPQLSSRSSQSDRHNSAQNKFAKKLIAQKRIKSYFNSNYQGQTQQDPQLPQFINSGSSDDFSFGGYHQSANTLSIRGSLLDPAYNNSCNENSETSIKKIIQKPQQLMLKKKEKLVAQRKMHTPIDELEEEDENSQVNEDISEEEREDFEEDIRERVNSRIRMTTSTVQTPSFLERSNQVPSSQQHIHMQQNAQMIPQQHQVKQLQGLNDYYKTGEQSQQVKSFQKSLKKKLIMKQIMKNKQQPEQPNVNIFIENYTNISIDPNLIYQTQQNIPNSARIPQVIEQDNLFNTLSQKMKDMAVQKQHVMPESFLNKFSKAKVKQMPVKQSIIDLSNMPSSIQKSNITEVNSSNFNPFINSGTLSSRNISKNQPQTSLQQMVLKSQQMKTQYLTQQKNTNQSSSSNLLGSLQSNEYQQRNSTANLLQNLNTLNSVNQHLKSKGYPQISQIGARPLTQVKQRPQSKNTLNSSPYNTGKNEFEHFKKSQQQQSTINTQRSNSRSRQIQQVIKREEDQAQQNKKTKAIIDRDRVKHVIKQNTYVN